MTEYQVITENTINRIFEEIANNIVGMAISDRTMDELRATYSDLCALQHICNKYFSELRGEEITQLPQIAQAPPSGGMIN
jgi:hypothetical protein